MNFYESKNIDEENFLLFAWSELIQFQQFFAHFAFIFCRVRSSADLFRWISS